MIGLIELTRYPHLYKFNKALNIKSYIRNIGGKAVRVTSHRRQAIMRAHEAADDLLAQTDSSAREYAYFMGKGGKLSQRIKGENEGVGIPRMGRRGGFFIHNHPKDPKAQALTLLPSISDLEMTSYSPGSVIAASKYGPYKARFYLKNRYADFAEIQREHNTRQLISLLFTNKSKPVDSIEMFASSYRETLRRNGDIFYREYGEPAKLIRNDDRSYLYEGALVDPKVLAELGDITKPLKMPKATKDQLIQLMYDQKKRKQAQKLYKPNKDETQQRINTEKYTFDDVLRVITSRIMRATAE